MHGGKTLHVDNNFDLSDRMKNINAVDLNLLQVFLSYLQYLNYIDLLRIHRRHLIQTRQAKIIQWQRQIWTLLRTS